MAQAGEEIRNPVAGMTLRFLRTAADTDGELLEMEATYEPSSIEPPVHFHPRQEERFQILEGTMQLEYDGERRELHPGDTLTVPAGVPHSMWNAGEVPARTRWETRPALRTEHFFETVSRLAREGKTNAGRPPARLPSLAAYPTVPLGFRCRCSSRPKPSTGSASWSSSVASPAPSRWR